MRGSARIVGGACRRCGSGRARARCRSRTSPAPSGRSARSSGSVTPLARSSFRMPKVSCTSIGDRPIEGSSIRMSFGSSSSPRTISSCFCSPPESVAACGRPCARRTGKRSSAASMRRRHVGDARCPRRRRRARGCGAPTARGRCCAPAARSRCRPRAAARGVQLVTSLPVEADRAGADRQQAEDRLEHGRLAGAVRADHGGDGAARHVEGHAVEDGHLAVAGDDACRARGSGSVSKIGLDDLRVRCGPPPGGPRRASCPRRARGCACRAT